MKNIIRVILLVIIMLLCCIDCHAETPKTNYQIVKAICKRQYNKTKIKIVKDYSKKTEKIITHRKGKNYIVVEKFVSYSCGGRYGYSKDGYYITYNKKVKKNKRVISYCIYNPYNNYFDDVTYVVDNRKVR